MHAHAHAPSPALNLWIQGDLVGKRIRLASRDGRDMVFVLVHDRDDLECRPQQRRLHGLGDLIPLCSSRQHRPPPGEKPQRGSSREPIVPTRFCPRRRKGDFHDPPLPADLLLRPSPAGPETPEPSPALSSPLLEEIYPDLSAHRAIGRCTRLELADECLYSQVYERIEFGVGNVGEREIQYIMVRGPEGGDVAVEEDGMENACPPTISKPRASEFPSEAAVPYRGRRP
jgi:hypothetical protein